MYPISHNTVSVAATVALPLPLPIEENNDNRRQRFTHHHKSMSCNDVYAAPTMRMSSNMMYSTSVHSPTTNANTTSNQHQHQHYYHGRKPSLVGFDPFDSSEQTQQQQQQQPVVTPSSSASFRHKKRLSIDTSLFAVGGSNNNSGGVGSPITATTIATATSCPSYMQKNTNQFQYERRHHCPPSSPQMMMTIPTSMKPMNNSSTTTTTPVMTNQNQNHNQFQFQRSSPPSSPQMMTIIPTSIMTMNAHSNTMNSSRDSSPTTIRSNNNTITVDGGRQPPTPPSAIDTSKQENNKSDIEWLTEEAPTPSSRTVSRTFKFLRKSSLVKSLSLGRVIGNTSSNNDNTAATAAAAAAAVSPTGATTNRNTNTTATHTADLESKNRRVSPMPSSPSNVKTNTDTNTDTDTDTDTPTKTTVQELMEFKDKFGTLNIPSLKPTTSAATTTISTSTLASTSAFYKPSPTSFLIGNTDEVVRTSEYEPSPYQIEIPPLQEIVTIARLNHIVDNYRRIDQNLDLTQFIGLNRIELQSRGVSINEHVPIVQSLLECGDDEISIQGYISSKINDDGSDSGSGVGNNTNTNTNTNDGNNDSSIDHQPDNRLEAVIFHGQRYFTVVFRGTTDQQCKILGNGGGSKSKKRAVPIDPELENVEVYSGFKDCGYTKLERQCFTLIDKLTEAHPFCDVVFTGYSYGAAMATLAAYRYANARPMMRVGCIPLASPKVGFSHFRHVVNSLPNLKVMRLELGQDSKCQGPTVGGWHVGHTLVLSTTTGGSSSSSSSSTAENKKNTTTTSTTNNNASVLAYKFDTPKHRKFFKTTYPDLKKYISTLEEMSTLKCPWAKDFVNTPSGEGVVGVNNESRNVV